MAGAAQAHGGTASSVLADPATEAGHIHEGTPVRKGLAPSSHSGWCVQKALPISRAPTDSSLQSLESRGAVRPDRVHSGGFIEGELSQGTEGSSKHQEMWRTKTLNGLLKTCRKAISRVFPAFLSPFDLVLITEFLHLEKF